MLLRLLPHLAFSFLGLHGQEMRVFHHQGYHVLVPGRNSCDLRSAGKELWDVLRRKSLACSGRWQLFLLCLHQYLNTSAHPADSLMVKVSLDIFLPQTDFHPLKPPTNCVFADAAGGGAVTNHTAQVGAPRGHKCKGSSPKCVTQPRNRA